MNIDPRRTIIPIIRTDVKEVNLVFAERGSKLGNHFHNDYEEHFFIISGLLHLNIEGKDSILHPFQIAKIEKGKNHTVIPLCSSKYLVFLSKPFNEEDPDIHGKENHPVLINPSKE